MEQLEHLQTLILTRKIMLQKLKIRSEDVSTQVIPRDRYAYLFSVIAIIASSLENLAIEIRHLQKK